MLKSTLAIIIFSFATTSFGITAVATNAQPDELNHLTTDLAERAQADVQIRRIKNMLISQDVDSDEAYEKLEKLQKTLHGSR